MIYTSTITKKGQITIPKPIRDSLGLKEGNNLLFVGVRKKKREIEIRAPEGFLEFARKVKVKKKIDPVKAREYMEKRYEPR